MEKRSCRNLFTKLNRMFSIEADQIDHNQCISMIRIFVAVLNISQFINLFVYLYIFVVNAY